MIGFLFNLVDKGHGQEYMNDYQSLSLSMIIVRVILIREGLFGLMYLKIYLVWFVLLLKRVSLAMLN